MRILFIRQPTHYSFPMLAAGMGTIATILSREGHAVRVIDNNSLYKSYSDRELIQIARAFRPQVVAFSLTIVNALATYRLLARMKRDYPEAIYLAGGMHAPAGFEEMLEYGFDLVVNREGELVVGPLFRHLEGKDRTNFSDGLSALKGVSFREREGRLRPASETPVIANLDDVPFVDYSLFNLSDFFKTGKEPAVILINGQRGCPFHCTFCSDAYLRADRRMASAEYMFGYVEYLHKTYGVSYIWIADNNFLFPRKRAMEFCRLMIASGLSQKVDLVAQSKVELAVDDELLAAIKKAGFTKIGFGLERLGLQAQEMICKKTSMENIHRIFSAVRRQKLNISINAIFGFPFDTVPLIRQERDLFSEVLPYVQNIVPNALTPIPQTPYYDNYPRVHRWYLNPRVMATARTYYTHAWDLAMMDTLDVNYFDLPRDVIREIKKLFWDLKKFNYGRYVLEKNIGLKVLSAIDRGLARLSRWTFYVSPELEFAIFRRVKFLRYYFATLLYGNKVSLPKDEPLS
jgi:radical SAM superfamily enzyme YgiQ (UPF0313 family)